MLITGTVNGDLPFKQEFRIDQEKFVSDKTGALQPTTIINLRVGDIVKFYFQDGTEFSGKIFQREEEMNEYVKVYGHINDGENSGFGFVITKQGGFFGAVVLKKIDINYAVDYNKESKSYYFVKILKSKNIL